MNNIFVPIKFEEWIKDHPELEGQEKKCKECSGSGFGECCECGSSIDCPDCNGNGVIDIARDIYDEQVLNDLIKLTKWQKSN